MVPKELKYTKDHEWIILAGDIATVGITDFAQRELGDIVYVEVESVGEALKSDSENLDSKGLFVNITVRRTAAAAVRPLPTHLF